MPEFLILNLHRVATITDAGLRLLTGLIKNQLPAATTAVIAGVEAASPLTPQLKALREQGVRVRIFPTYDAAVEWAEDQVVYRHGGFSRIEVEADLSRQALLAGLSPQELADLSRLGTRVVFPAGTRIISANEPPARVYFLLRGMVSARSVGDVRLSTMIPGMVFGEMALIEQPRSTDVWADTEAVCVEVTADQFRAFQETHARAADRIMRNLAILLAGRMRMATARIEMLTG